MWAEEGLGFLSYRFANEALRGNEYPDGEALSVTLTGLTEGATVQGQGPFPLQQRRPQQFAVERAVVK